MLSRNEQMKGLRVLLVEDSWHAAQAMRDVLEGWGVDVIGPVASSDEAKKKIAADVPPVAIVDLRLSDGLAYPLIDLLNELKVNVIIASGYADAMELRDQVAAVLQKPFATSALHSALMTIIEGQGLNR